MVCCLCMKSYRLNLLTSQRQAHIAGYAAHVMVIMTGCIQGSNRALTMGEDVRDLPAL